MGPLKFHATFFFMPAFSSAWPLFPIIHVCLPHMTPAAAANIIAGVLTPAFLRIAGRLADRCLELLMAAEGPVDPRPRRRVRRPPTCTPYMRRARWRARATPYTMAYFAHVVERAEDKRKATAAMNPAAGISALLGSELGSPAHRAMSGSQGPEAARRPALAISALRTLSGAPSLAP